MKKKTKKRIKGVSIFTIIVLIMTSLSYFEPFGNSMSAKMFTAMVEGGLMGIGFGLLLAGVCYSLFQIITSLEE